MVRADIVSGIRNAVERGESIELAMQSMINAGYNAEEVKSAAQMLSSGRAGYGETYSPPEQKISQVPQQQYQSQQQNYSGYQQLPRQAFQQPKQKSHIGMIILLVGILIILAALLVGILFFKSEILSFLKGIVG